MSRLYLIFFLLFRFLLLHGQNTTEDLLEQLKRENDNEAKIELLTEIADKTGKINPEQALEYAKQALDLSKKIQNKELIARSQLTLAYVQYDTQNFQKSVEYGKLCEPYFEKSNDYNRLANLYNLLSSSYFCIADPAMTDYYADKCIQLAEKYQMTDILNKQYYNRGAILYYRGDYSRSLEYAFKALNLAKKNNNHTYIAICCDLMGNLSYKMEDYRDALRYFERSRQLYLRENDKISIGQSYYNTANTYLNLHHTDSAYWSYHQAMAYYKDTDSYDGMSLVYTGIAQCYKQKAMYDSAQFFIEKSLKIGLLSESKKDLVTSYYEAGSIANMQGNYKKASEYWHKSLSLARQTGYKDNEANILLSLGQTYATLGKHDSAYRFLSRSLTIKDSLNNTDNIRQRAYLLAEHNVKEQIENEIETEQQKRKLWLIIVGLCSVVILILSFSIRILSVRQNKIKSINAELKKYRSELENILKDKTRELVHSEQQILNLSNNLPNGAIFRFAFENEREGKILFASSGWEELTGQSLETANDSVFFFQNRIHPDDSRELLNQLTYAIRHKSILDATYRFYRNNTEMRWFHLRAIAIAGDDGVTYLDGYQVDETDQKYFEQELVAAKEKAEESDKLKSAFLANMSHEIRTPMNAIIGFSSLLSNAQLPPKRQKAYLELVQESCQYLLRLIDDIVDISKIEAEQLTLRMETCYVSEIMKSIKEYFEPIIQNKYPHVELWIDESFGNTSLTIYTDIFRLKQIFLNLIENALKFTEKGFVRCGYLLDRADAVHFYVTDTGIGIAHENVEAIFQSFRKVDQFSGGTGLGLSIVKRLLLQMGGSIWVESELGVGSTFHFTLPFPSE